MSGFTIDPSYVYRILSDLRENKSIRYIRREVDADMNEYYVAIYNAELALTQQNVKYIISVSPIASLTTTLASQIVYYQVYVNPSTTELIVTQIQNATPISFSISNSLIYLFYNNSSYGLQFNCPYTNITGCKEAILSLFTYPCFVVMLYGMEWIQFSYINNAYEPVLTGSFMVSQMLVHNTFDYNNTFFVRSLGQPQAYWNSNRFASTNQLPYISYTSSASGTSAVVGFQDTYIIEPMTSGVDVISISSTSSLNIPSGNNIRGIHYSSLSKLVPLKPTVSSSAFLKYYLSGVAGIGYSGTMYATIQEVNLLNSNNVYASTSAVIVPVTSNTGLNRYGTTDFYYLYDPSTMTLTVWDTPTQPSFNDFLSSNQATIITSDMVQLTTEQINAFNQHILTLNPSNNNDEKKMGANCSITPQDDGQGWVRCFDATDSEANALMLTLIPSSYVGTNSGYHCDSPYTKYSSGNKATCVKYYKYYSTPSPAYQSYATFTAPLKDSCVLPTTPITMADGTQKPIIDITQGEYVLSGKTGRPVRVLENWTCFLGVKNLVGFNGIDPFITEDHTLIDPDNVETHLSFVPTSNPYHFESIRYLEKGGKIILQGESVPITSMVFEKNEKKYPESTVLYDLITEDHSYVANGVSIHDDFPAIDRHPMVSIVIFHILLHVSENGDITEDMSSTDILRQVGRIYNKYSETAMIAAQTILVESNYDSYYEEFQSTLFHLLKQTHLYFLAIHLWTVCLPMIQRTTELLQQQEEESSRTTTRTSIKA